MIDRTMTLSEDGRDLVGVLAVADVPNVNGHIYPRETLERFISEQMKNRFFICDKLDGLGRIQLARVGAEVIKADLREDGALVVQAQILITESGGVLRKLAGDQTHGLSMACMGTVGPGNVIRDAVLNSITVAKVEDLGGPFR
jgi:hypothetical protein